MSRQGNVLMPILCATAVIGLAVAAVRAQDQPPAETLDVTALQAEIEALREQVAELETRVAELEGGIRPLEFQFTPDGSQVVPRTSPAPGIPGRRPQGEINGVPYYIIPIREPHSVNPMDEQ